jgi:hypothetical protein
VFAHAAPELKASFAAKRARIGPRQGILLDQLTNQSRGRQSVSLEELANRSGVNGNELYYRLEQLRLLGFVAKLDLGQADGNPVFGWTLSDNYRRDIGL